jgi:hypothetical protein
MLCPLRRAFAGLLIAGAPLAAHHSFAAEYDSTKKIEDKFWFDYLGHPHTEQLHTVERYTRTDLGNMTIEVTINDPGAYAKPFTTTGRARLQPAGEEILEYICQENNIDLVHVNAPAQLP